MKRQVTVAQLVVLVSAVVVLLFSFFPFLGVSGVEDADRNAWGSGMFPLATYPALIAAGIGVLVALSVFGGVKLPGRVLGYSWPQIYAAAGVFALLIMLGWLITDKGGWSLQFGAILMLLGSIGLVVGTTMELLGMGSNVLTAPAAPAAPAAPPAPPGGGAAPTDVPPPPPAPPTQAPPAQAPPPPASPAPPAATTTPGTPPPPPPPSSA